MLVSIVESLKAKGPRSSAWAKQSNVVYRRGPARSSGLWSDAWKHVRSTWETTDRSLGASVARGLHWLSDESLILSFVTVKPCSLFLVADPSPSPLHSTSPHRVLSPRMAARLAAIRPYFCPLLPLY